MKPGSVQIVKEVRQLAWPWTILMMAGTLVLARPWLNTALPDVSMGANVLRRLLEWVLPVGTFVGSSLLAALPLGSEFQYRTLAMHFAQPVDREKLWRQKFLITIAAVAPLSIIYCIAIGMHSGWPLSLMAVTWIVVTTAGAIPFTLIARTTVGGMVLNVAGGTAVIFSWSHYERYGQIPLAWMWTLGIALIAYSFGMIWLGHRMFLRFQAVDGMQAGEGFVPGARLLPQAVSEWFRCRPRQPYLNLVRREFHLMRSLWPLIVLNLIAWIFLVVFRQLPGNREESALVGFGLTVILGVIICVLSGTLSLGEEKTWGTHEWHMTSPISISLQWGVKLLFAAVTSLVSAAFLPMLVLTIGSWMGRSSALPLNAEFVTSWILEAVGLTLIAFLCACMVKGAVQATLWVFPLCLGVALASQAADLLDSAFRYQFQELMAGFIRWIDPMTIGRAYTRMLMNFSQNDILALAVAPMVAIALIQSHRLFRGQVPANKLRVVRCALPLMFVAFLCTLGSDLFFRGLYASWRQQSTILNETGIAIATLASSDSGTGAVHPRHVMPEELAKAMTLSEETRHWLRNANILVAPAPEHLGVGPGPHFPGRILFSIPASKLRGQAPYSAVIRAASGTQCALTFQIQEQGPVGFLTAICE